MKSSSHMIKIRKDKLKQIITEENRRYHGEFDDPKVEAVEKLEEILEQLDEQIFLYEESELHKESKYLENKTAPELNKENIVSFKEALLEILEIIDKI